MKVLFIIDTFHRGRHFLIELPFNSNVKRKLSSLNQIDTNINSKLLKLYKRN